MSTTLTKTQIWGAPTVLGIVSAVGLVSALLADGLWDAVSWMALAAPVAVSAWGLWWPRQSALDKRTPPNETHPVGSAEINERKRKRATIKQEKKVSEK